MRSLLGRRILVWLFLTGIIAAALFFAGQMRKAEEYQAIRAMSWVVAGHTYIVDPGHGGEDPGKVGPSGIYEKDINLAVAKKLLAVLNQGGGSTILTRDTDISLSDGEDTVRARKRADLFKRVEIAEKTQADLFISLHCNAFPEGKWYGAQTFFNPDVPGSKELATYIQEEIAGILGNTTRKPKPDTSSIVMKRAKMPIVNVEMGFLSNPRESELLRDPGYQDKLAWCIYSGVVRFLVEYGEQFKPTVNYINK